MIIKTVKTPVVHAGKISLEELIDQSVESIEDGSILVITSKIVSLCAGKVVPNTANKDDLVKQNSTYYLDRATSDFGLSFTIAHNTLIPSAGIDESNGDDQYILWLDDFQAVANQVREHLAKKHSLKNFGVIITDSTCTPMRRGTVGISLAHSGFLAVKDYIGKPDLFGRPFKVSLSNLAGGLASGAVAMMGEGTESTPLALISDLPFIEFQSRNPSNDELALIRIDKDEDLFAPFLNAVDWRRGRQADK